MALDLENVVERMGSILLVDRRLLCHQLRWLALRCGLAPGGPPHCYSDVPPCSKYIASFIINYVLEGIQSKYRHLLH